MSYNKKLLNTFTKKDKKNQFHMIYKLSTLLQFCITSKQLFF